MNWDVWLNDDAHVKLSEEGWGGGGCAWLVSVKRDLFSIFKNYLYMVFPLAGLISIK